MNKKRLLVDETMYVETLDNGLKIYMQPKPDFVDYHVSLQVNMGGESINYEFGSDKFEIPSGMAHFLEHIMFENHESNLSDVFSTYNADVNASTSRDLTRYYFSAQENFEQVLRIFLDHFSSFDISERVIAKERAIILKEIKMYEDNLFYQVHDDLMKHMYRDPKVWEDIAGSSQSVKKITKELIDRTITHFYQAKNMYLVITGPFEPEEVKKIIHQSKITELAVQEYLPILKYDLKGSKKRNVYKTNQKQSVEYLALGLKIDLSLFSHLETSQKRLAIIMFFEHFFNESSKNYQILKKEKLINYSYYQTTSIMDQYAYFFVSSESRYPSKLKDRLIEMLLNLETIDERLFIASKRARIGHYIGYFDSAKSVMSAIIDFTKKSIDFENYINNVSHISVKDLEINKLYMKKENIYTVIYAKK